MSIDFNSLSAEELEAVLNGPALTPPSGVTPNFNSPPNRSTMANGVYGFCFALGSLFVFARAYGLWRSSKRAHISDYMTLVSYGLYAGFMTVIFCQVHIGYFVHQWDFRLKDVSKLFYLFHVATNVWAATIMLIKATILVDWLHIFVPVGTRNYFWWISIFLISLDLLFYSAAIIAINLTCKPHAKLYDPLVGGTCSDSRAIDITSSVINFLIDLAILILPQRVIWGLRMSFQKRLGVSAVFVVGFM
uniref:Rhodopsin domain-containing protein n=1 Tax=Bionectria ochroleuca TaxID=29856 RepID=A0A8H7KE22_BIOOC